MKEDTKRKRTPDPSQDLRIYVTPTHYVPVNAQGYWIGKYFEGALGCVVEALHRDEGSSGSRTQQLALKIPRLLADSDRENAYIEARFRDEVRAADEFLNTDKLVSPKATMVLGSRQGTNPPDTKRVVLVRFEKGRAPCVCEATRGLDGKIKIFPALPERAAPLDTAVHELFARLEKDQSPEIWVCSTNGDAGKVARSASGIRLLKDELPMQSQDCPWYAFVPSILYTWYPQTLEQLLCQDAQAAADGAGPGGLRYFEKKLELTRSVLEGVVELHEHRRPFLHNDIRSANVLVRSGVGKLGDYGSMSFSGPFAGPGTGGGTWESVELSPRRAAPYYAVERRSGQEIESVNAACVCWKDEIEDHAHHTGYLVVAGFQDDLFRGPGEVTELVASIASAAKPGAQAWSLDKKVLAPRNSLDALKRGDRVRLRDLVFVVSAELQVVGSPVPAGMRVFACEAPYSRLMHGSIPVKNRELDAKTDQGVLELRVPSLIELLQWSAASDVYSIGVIALDIAFRGGRAEQDRRNGPARFEQMVRRMEDPGYFEYQWPRLDAVCRELTEYKESSASKLATLQRSVQRVVRGLGGQTPNAKELLENLDNNGAHFLMLVHFALCCMHRAETYTLTDSPLAKELGSGGMLCAPFCRDRCEAPGNGAAKRALEYLQTVIDATRRKAPLSEVAPDPRKEGAVRPVFWCDIGEYQGPEELSEQVAALSEQAATLGALHRSSVAHGRRMVRNGVAACALVLVLGVFGIVSTQRVARASESDTNVKLKTVTATLRDVHAAIGKAEASERNAAQESAQRALSKEIASVQGEVGRLLDDLDKAVQGMVWKDVRNAGVRLRKACDSFEAPPLTLPSSETVSKVLTDFEKAIAELQSVNNELPVAAGAPPDKGVGASSSSGM